MASPVLSLASVKTNGPSQPPGVTLSTVGNAAAAAMGAHHGVTVVRPLAGGMTGVQATSSGAVQMVNMNPPTGPAVIAGAQPQKIMGPRIQTGPTLRIQPAIAPRPNVIQMAGQVNVVFWLVGCFCLFVFASALKCALFC